MGSMNHKNGTTALGTLRRKRRWEQNVNKKTAARGVAVDEVEIETWIRPWALR